MQDLTRDMVCLATQVVGRVSVLPTLGIFNINDDQILLNNGFKYIPVITPVENGYTRSSVIYIDNGTDTAIVSYTDIKNPDVVDIISPVIPIAKLYRSILRTLFGDNAEINTDISQAYVMKYFTDQIVENGSLTPLQLTQETVLQTGFQTLTQFTKDGTTWSFPWSFVPE